MEAPITAPIAPIAPAPIAPPPPPAPVIPATPITESTGAFSGMQILGVKVEYVVLGTISVIVAFYGMGIAYYRKGIKTNNTIENLQNQIDQLKLSINTKTK